MTGAIEFLRKAKAICNSDNIPCSECPLTNMCGDIGNIENPADLVRKVIDYRLEDKNE